MMKADIVIVGAGASGLSAAIAAGETSRGQLTIVLVDSTAHPGSKILVSGGGRCNVTNQSVSAQDYRGGPSSIIGKVLRAFDEAKTADWFKELGVPLKVEPDGKCFPRSDSARTVLEALQRRCRSLGVEEFFGARVNRIERDHDLFSLFQHGGEFVSARRLVVATGGLALPKSGSDGAGLNWMRELGHTIIPTTPALAPLVLNANTTVGGRLREVSGVTLDLRLTFSDRDGRRIAEETGAVIITHFGLSGPAAMNISRAIARWRLEHADDPGVLTLGNPAFVKREDADVWLRDAAKQWPRRYVSNALWELFPSSVCELLGDGFQRMADLTREGRRELSERLSCLKVDVAGLRGYASAEATAGGVCLREIDARTMESRVVPGLHLCGEILDVDGRIGGFNLQWAWASGHVAGQAAARLCLG